MADHDLLFIYKHIHVHIHIRHIDISRSLSPIFFFFISFLPQAVKADERPLESGSAPAFFLHGEFFLAPVTLLLHPEDSLGFSSACLI